MASSRCSARRWRMRTIRNARPKETGKFYFSVGPEPQEIHRVAKAQIPACRLLADQAWPHQRLLPGTPPIHSGQVRILVVEDNALALQLLSGAPESRGYSVARGHWRDR